MTFTNDELVLLATSLRQAAQQAWNQRDKLDPRHKNWKFWHNRASKLDALWHRVAPLIRRES